MKQLQAMKYILYGTENHEPNSELVAQLAQETYSNHILQEILLILSQIDFEVSDPIIHIIFNMLFQLLLCAAQSMPSQATRLTYIDFCSLCNNIATIAVPV